MRFRLRMAAGMLGLACLAVAMPSAHAQCGGGGYNRSGFYGGHTFNSGYSRGYGVGCGSGGMQMGGMQMGGMAMSAASMQGMNMGSNASPAVAAPVPAAPPPATAATAGSQYYCPMHPNVTSTFPATCPYCQMALKSR